MAMQKIGDIEKGLEVLRGREAQALERLEARFGKRIHEFSDDERAELRRHLLEAQKQEAEDAKSETPAESTSEASTIKDAPAEAATPESASSES